MTSPFSKYYWDALSLKYVPISVDWLIAGVQQMGIAYCFNGVVDEHTQYILQLF